MKKYNKLAVSHSIQKQFTARKKNLRKRRIYNKHYNVHVLLDYCSTTLPITEKAVLINSAISLPATAQVCHAVISTHRLAV